VSADLPRRSVRRFITAGLILPSLLLLSARGAPLGAQSESATATGPRRGLSGFIGYSLTNLAGGVSKGGAAAPILGLALERPIGARVSWRAELIAIGGAADLGRTGLFELPTKVSVAQWGIGAGARRYSGGSTFLGAGASVTSVSVCDVDTEGGPGFLGGQTEDCADFADIPLSKGSTVVAVNLSAGVRRGPFELEARVDQGLQASVQSAQGAMRLRTLGLVLHYRFGR